MRGEMPCPDSPQSSQSQPPSGVPLFKGEKPRTSPQGADHLVSGETAALGAPRISFPEWGLDQVTSGLFREGPGLDPPPAHAAPDIVSGVGGAG